MSWDDLFREMAARFGESEEDYWNRIRVGVVISTLFLRTAMTAPEARIRQLLDERGVDVGTAVVPEFHEEDETALFGVVVSHDRSAFAFDFHWGWDADDHPPPEAGIITQWEVLTPNWEQSTYARDVFVGFKALDEGWVDHTPDQRNHGDGCFRR
jgi:hypothetical protein